MIRFGQHRQSQCDYGSLLKFPNVLSNELSSAPRYRDSCKFLRAASEPELGAGAASALFHPTRRFEQKKRRVMNNHRHVSRLSVNYALVISEIDIQDVSRFEICDSYL